MSSNFSEDIDAILQGVRETERLIRELNPPFDAQAQVEVAKNALATAASTLDRINLHPAEEQAEASLAQPIAMVAMPRPVTGEKRSREQRDLEVQEAQHGDMQTWPMEISGGGSSIYEGSDKEEEEKNGDLDSDGDLLTIPDSDDDGDADEEVDEETGLPFGRGVPFNNEVEKDDSEDEESNYSPRWYDDIQFAQKDSDLDDHDEDDEEEEQKDDEEDEPTTEEEPFVFPNKFDEKQMAQYVESDSDDDVVFSPKREAKEQESDSEDDVVFVSKRKEKEERKYDSEDDDVVLIPKSKRRKRKRNRDSSSSSLTARARFVLAKRSSSVMVEEATQPGNVDSDTPLVDLATSSAPMTPQQPGAIASGEEADKRVYNQLKESIKKHTDLVNRGHFATADDLNRPENRIEAVRMLHRFNTYIRVFMDVAQPAPLPPQHYRKGVSRIKEFESDVIDTELWYLVTLVSKGSANFNKYGGDFEAAFADSRKWDISTMIYATTMRSSFESHGISSLYVPGKYGSASMVDMIMWLAIVSHAKPHPQKGLHVLFNTEICYYLGNWSALFFLTSIVSFKSGIKALSFAVTSDGGNIDAFVDGVRAFEERYKDKTLKEKLDNSGIHTLSFDTRLYTSLGGEFLKLFKESLQTVKFAQDSNAADLGKYFKLPYLKENAPLELKFYQCNPVSYMTSNPNGGRRKRFGEALSKKLLIRQIEFDGNMSRKDHTIDRWKRAERLRMYDDLESLQFANMYVSVASLSLLRTRIANQNHEYPKLNVKFTNCTFPPTFGHNKSKQWDDLFTQMQKKPKAAEGRRIIPFGSLEVRECTNVSAEFLCFVIGMCRFEHIDIVGDNHTEELQETSKLWIRERDPFHGNEGLKHLKISKCPMDSIPYMSKTKTYDRSVIPHEQAMRFVSSFKHVDRVIFTDITGDQGALSKSIDQFAAVYKVLPNFQTS